MTGKIMTLHPEGKQGVNIDKVKYDLMRSAIINVLKKRGTLTFTDLMQTVQDALDGNFDGSISWYLTTVKLDLEARKEIERIPKSSPQMLRLTR